MKMRIVVPEAADPGTLAQRLSATFGLERVSCGAHRADVAVLVKQESDPAVLRVLDVVEHWLEHTPVVSTEMWLGNHAYRISRRPPAGAWH